MVICKKYYGDWGLGIGDWGLGIGDWGQSPIPNPHVLNNIKICIIFFTNNHINFEIISKFLNIYDIELFI